MSADWKFAAREVVEERALRMGSSLLLVSFEELELESCPGKRDAFLLYLSEDGYMHGLEWYAPAERDLAMSGLQSRFASETPHVASGAKYLIDVPLSGAETFVTSFRRAGQLYEVRVNQGHFSVYVDGRRDRWLMSACDLATYMASFIADDCSVAA